MAFPIEYIDGEKGVKIAFRHWFHSTQADAPLLILVNGRAENLRKWRDLAAQFYAQGFDVLQFDHRGQGYSSRLLISREKGHLDDFDFYLRDMATVLNEILARKNYVKRYLLAHSMGALISAHFLLKYPHQICRAVFSAPFFGVPFKRPILDKWLIRAMVAAGFGEQYVFGKGKFSFVDALNNKLSHNAQAMMEMNRIHLHYPKLRLGGPTFRWVKLCQDAIEQLPEILPKIDIPILILQAECDEIVANRRLVKLSQCLIHGKLQLIAQAKHEILFERADIRERALAEIASFWAKENERD